MPTYQINKHRIATRENIRLISAHIDARAETAWDIGSALGVLSCHLDNLGLKVTAFEKTDTFVQAADSFMAANYNSYTIRNEPVTPELIDTLDSVDVIIFLSSHHQMVEHYGLDAANRIFVSLYKKAKYQLFFQPAAIFDKYTRRMPFIENDSLSIFEYFTSVLRQAGENPQAQLVGISHNDLPPSEPFRPMFLFSKNTGAVPKKIHSLDSYKAEHNDNCRLVYANMESCISENSLQAFSADKWHYFTESVKDILAEKSNSDNILYKYYKAIQPDLVQDLYSMAGVADILFKQRYGVRYYDIPLLWHKASSTSSDNKITDSKFHLFGPMPDELIEWHINSLRHLVDKIKLEGYAPEVNPDGYIKGYILRKNGSSRFVVLSGQHRVAVLAALGYKDFLVKFHPTANRLVEYEQATDWPLVRDGVLSLQEARCMFDAVFGASGAYCMNILDKFIY